MSFVLRYRAGGLHALKPLARAGQYHAVVRRERAMGIGRAEPLMLLPDGQDRDTIPSCMRPIDKARFDALAGYIRLPEHVFFMRELAWYEEGGEVLLGVLALHLEDQDYAGIVLARDAKRRFRAVTLKHSFSTQAEATSWLQDAMARLVKEPAEVHFQGDGKGGPVDFFKPVVAVEKRAIGFEQLRTEPSSSPALGLVREMMHYFDDVDGNFVQQFQSQGFDARLWELYLYATFTEMGYRFNRAHSAPDFHCVGPTRPAVDRGDHVGDFAVHARTHREQQRRILRGIRSHSVCRGA